LFDTSAQRASLGAQVRGIDVPLGSCRATAFAHHAAREAVDQARLDARALRVGLVVGGTTAGMFENEVRVAGMMAGKIPFEPHPELRSHPLSSTADALDAALGPFVRTRTVASACSSGLTALTVAMAWLSLGEVDAVIAGGTDALCRLTLSGFNALSAIDPEPCRPFDRQRRGLNLGEGAGFVVLERADGAARRGQSPLAELAGISLAAEAHHITNPEAEGTTAARVMTEALARAGVEPSSVDYVNAHGTGTPLNDAMETKALTRVFGSEVERVWVSSSKAQIGHTLAAAGAIETVIATLAVAHGILPPTAGLADPDPMCALRHVKAAVRMERVRAVLSSSFGFGGMDGAVVITTPELAREPSVAQRRVRVSSAACIGPRGAGDGSGLTTGDPAGGPAPDESFALNPGKARRFDRSARLCAAVTHALNPPTDAGVVFGSAFSSVDEAALFVQRIFDKGPRLASPLEFPNLVPSSPVGHASVYEGLRGPALATADLRTSGESAVATAIELIEAGYADAFVAGAVSVKSGLIDAVFHPLFDDGASHALRAELCAAVLLESGSDETGVRVEVHIARKASDLALPPPGDVSRARVFGALSTQFTASLLEKTAWGGVSVESTEPGVGSNEAGGPAALGAALRAIERNEVDVALVASAREGAAYAFVVRARR
jgi:3-oxoacyl-[acyl-carrier-protein] synthase II